jgi:pyruvate/2-oxoglutarate dehydrogenase complex dihydrolipoamide acyltransferase (E2) component
MPVNIVMPKVGAYDMESATLLRWLKREGDPLQAGDLIAEVESAKAVLEMPSPHTGTLLRTLVAEGTEVPVGQVIAVVALAEENL